MTFFCYHQNDKIFYHLSAIFRYEAGDHVAVYPTNDSALVEKFGEILNVDLDTVITLTNVDGKENVS